MRKRRLIPPIDYGPPLPMQLEAEARAREWLARLAVEQGLTYEQLAAKRYVLPPKIKRYSPEAAEAMSRKIKAAAARKMEEAAFARKIQELLGRKPRPK